MSFAESCLMKRKIGKRFAFFFFFLFFSFFSCLGSLINLGKTRLFSLPQSAESLAMNGLSQPLCLGLATLSNTAEREQVISPSYYLSTLNPSILQVII